MAQPKQSFIYYGTAAFSGAEVTAIAKFDLVIMAACPNFEANRDALKAERAACKVLVYINYMDGNGNNSAMVDAYLAQISLEGWLLKQSPASSATSPLLTLYKNGTYANSFNVNPTKVGGTSGDLPGVWYVENAISSLYVDSDTDGFFFDVMSIGPFFNYASTVDAGNSGTSTATTGAGQIADSGKAWGTNTQLGRLVRMTSGAAAGLVNWVETNTGTVLTLRFNFSVAPSSGDTYEMYNYSAALSTISAVDADYLETSTPTNNDSITWRKAIAAAQRATMDALIAAYPNKIVIVNDGRGWDCAEVRGLSRDYVGVFAEGVIGSGYEIGFTSAMSSMRCITRRLSPYCILQAHPANATTWTTARYAMVAAMMADAYVCNAPANNLTTTTTMYLDEYNVDVGTPVDAAARNDDGTWYREYTAGYIVANPTAGAINVAVPAGFRRIDATDYASQDTTLNDGTTDTVSLAATRAVMFVPV